MRNLVFGLTLLVYFCLVECSPAAPTTPKKEEKPVKCAPSDAQIGISKKCFKKVVGKDPGGPDDVKIWENEDKKTKIVACIFSEMEIVDDGGFNVDNAEKAILEMKAEEETKDALIEGMRKCTDDFEKEEVDKIMSCIEEENQSVCADGKDGKA